MRFSFIGMSNIGKSTWAHRIVGATGITHFNCDAMIEKKLGDSFASSGRKGLKGVAGWMGLPSDPFYNANSERYQLCEQEVMREIFSDLRDNAHPSAIIDTTGSVIYTGDRVLQEMRALTRVVYFEASPEHIEALYKNYMANPKPVIWDDAYVPQDGEASAQTLRRCYPLLLRQRAVRYKEIAHMTIPFDLHRDRTTDIHALLKGSDT